MSNTPNICRFLAVLVALILWSDCTSARDFNVTVNLYANSSEPPAQHCTNLAPQACCQVTYDKTYTLVEFIGLNESQLAMAWVGQDRPEYGYCGVTVAKTAQGSGSYPLHTNLTSDEGKFSSASWGFSGDLEEL